VVIHTLYEYAKSCTSRKPSYRFISFSESADLKDYLPKVCSLTFQFCLMYEASVFDSSFSSLAECS
jgi:hypothetical protein